MPGPPGKHVAFVEQQTLMQRGRCTIARVKKQIHFVAIRLLNQPRRLQLKQRQTAGRRGDAQRVERRQQNRRRHIVGRRHPPGLRRRGRVKRLSRRHRQLQRQQRIAQRPAQLIGAGGGLHSARPRQQQRVGENFPQSRQLDANRRLRQVEALRRPGDVIFAKQDVKRA